MNIGFLKFKSGAVKILFLALFWGLAGILFTLNAYLSIKHFVVEGDTGLVFEYSLAKNMLIAFLVASIGGILLGTTEVIYFQKKFRGYSFGKAIIFKSLFYSAGLLILIFIGSVFYHTIFSGRSFFDEAAYAGVKHHMFSSAFWSQLITWSVVIIITQFVLVVKDKFGKGVLLQLILGKYHRPKTEERIFMFLDLKSSTTIAEKLKHQKYFKFLNDFYNDIADPIIFNRGEIYQYVGDEVVVSWKLRDKNLNENCIKCFFDILNTIDKKKEYYKNNYGVVPEFKAGIHLGEVITGEIGAEKKEIVFSGDVLNTTSRIQNECKRLDIKLIISASLVSVFPKESDYFFMELGDIVLRGKEESVKLFSVDIKQQ